MTVGGAVTGAQCVFPFSFGGQVFSGCASRGDPDHDYSEYYDYEDYEYYDYDYDGGEDNDAFSGSGSGGEDNDAFSGSGSGGEDNDAFSGSWCSTATDDDGVHVPGKWGNCPASCENDTKIGTGILVEKIFICF